MQCPYCQHTNSRVLESRSSEGGQSIRRRRECLSCKHRFTTYERIEFVPITVIKHDGKKESFDASKLLRGMVRACEKTGISHQRLETIVDDIEAYLQQRPQREVTTHEIGQLVLKYLREENEVAYVRFASVYGRFKGIKDFMETLDQLQEETLSPPVPQWSNTSSTDRDKSSSSPCLSLTHNGSEQSRGRLKKINN